MFLKRGGLKVLNKPVDFIKNSKKYIYYDNLELNRNLNFVFNLGYNEIPYKIKPNVFYNNTHVM